MATTSLQPVFARISTEEKSSYDLFMDYTNISNIGDYGRGWSLEKLTDLAEKAYDVVSKTNPIVQERSEALMIQGRQWELNQLSDIKRRLGLAITNKRNYYDNTFMGMVTKFVLKFFGMWNNGDTAAIVKAEDFLIKYDSRIPLDKESNGDYTVRCFFPIITATWVRATLDLTRFYNYNPRRAIPVVVNNFHFDTLDHRNPVISIRG